ncbi:hypothetical protein PENSOL_c009G01747 [Penicillium solitum]|uniref:Fatty acyl-CoA reductase n=1 Tax=Penicillium solitum TaxID=60172 RepID=A0A1V6RAR2_9EURO|nr:uncharacterized protein PENSOL_c009G01747 [Penicillium solitum]OQD98489.1 hypothetical protein PENSOL_c009G01747 [Penicillium solitum]
MWEYYEGKSILVTGGSGFLGTAIVHRLLMSTCVSRIYLVCRGGNEKLQSRWREWLPDDTVDKLCDSNRLVVLDGDILLPSLGLSQSELELIRNNTNIIIHAASAINLGSRLKRACIVSSVSSAYSNTHLYYRSHESDVQINEDIYQLENEYNILDELNEVRKHGTSQAYEAENFPWAYGYAKHLTERLLQHRFSEHASDEQLLIVRPGIIGPSQCLPFPGYIMPMSSPYTMLAAAFALVPSRAIKIASKMENPDAGVTGDEVPVDVVADRLLCHLALGTSGCIHAVSGVKSRLKLETWRHSLMKLRRIPWGLQPLWVKADWKSTNQHCISRLYAICGASFAFSEEKTIKMCKEIPEKEQQNLQLFTQIDTSENLLTQTAGIRYAMDQYARKSTIAWLIVWLFYSDFGKIDNTNGSAEQRSVK